MISHVTLVLILIPNSEYETIVTSIHDFQRRDLCVRFICEHVRDELAVKHDSDDNVRMKQQVNNARLNLLRSMDLDTGMVGICPIMEIKITDEMVCGLGLVTSGCLN